MQALVRLPLVQRQRDLAAGLNTAGYVTGYRGSPLGTYDQQLERAQAHLDAHHIVHQPGVNEDLAATACSGTQQVGLDGESRYDGVFAIWYAKGPGVDRSRRRDPPRQPVRHGPAWAACCCCWATTISARSQHHGAPERVRHGRRAWCRC